MIFFALFSILLVSGCDFLRETKPPLEGKRISLAEVPLPPSFVASPLEASRVPLLSSETWLQAGGNSHHVMGPFALPQRLALVQEIRGAAGRQRVPVSPIATPKAIFVLTDSGSVRAFNWQGDLLWEASLGKPPEGLEGRGGGLASDGVRIYVTTPWGEIVALEARTGQVLWRRALSAPARNGPSLSQGYLCVLTLKNKLEVFQAATGHLAWSHSGLSEEISLAGGSVPAIYEDRVVVAYSSGEVTALSLFTGEVMWDQSGAPLKSLGEGQKLAHIKALPVIEGGAVYTISYNGQLSCFDLFTGEAKWTYALSGVEAPLKIGKVLFCVTHDHQLMALEAQKGQPLWSHKLEGEKPWAGPIMAGGLLYCLSGTRLEAFDPAQKGRKVASYGLPEECELPPVIVKDRLLVISKTGNIYIFSALQP